MSTRSRIVWWLERDAAEFGDGEHVYMTKGWLDESDMLRWTLSRALTTEGTHQGWFPASEAAEAAEISWGHDDEGTPVTIATLPISGA